MKTYVKILIILLAAVLIAELGYLGWLFTGNKPGSEPGGEALQLPDTTLSTQPATEPETLPEETTVPETTEAPQPKTYTITFGGDCTLGSSKDSYGAGYSFIGKVGENHSWPFQNLLPYFGSDDMTIVNLEGPLTDEGSAAQKTFAFRGPTTYGNILTEGSVEAVTLANNHSMDYGQIGYDSTKQVLEERGISYGGANAYFFHETASGLKVGVYCASFRLDVSDLKAKVDILRGSGAQVIILAIHWGEEGVYRCNADQQKMAHDAIDAGVDIVYGHHPHVLQKIEEYNGGIIYYSLGNLSFGGHAQPRDKDTAILQQQIIVDPDGTVTLGELKRIPCWITSDEGQVWNNYQPTPVPEDDPAYARILSKLDGTFTGADLNVEYDRNPTPETTEPPVTDTPAENPPVEDTPADTPPADNTPPADSPPADTSSGDTPPADSPPADTPPADTPPADPPAEG